MTASQSRDRSESNLVSNGVSTNPIFFGNRLHKRWKEMRWLGSRAKTPLGSLAHSSNGARYLNGPVRTETCFQHHCFSASTHRKPVSAPPQSRATLCHRPPALAAPSPPESRTKWSGAGPIGIQHHHNFALGRRGCHPFPSPGGSGVGPIQKKPPSPLQTHHHGLSLPGGETRPKTPSTRHGIVSPQLQRRCGSVQHLIKSL